MKFVVIVKEYIDKAALVVEVKRRQKIHFNDYHINGNNSPADYGACNALTQILDFINTLEVKEVENTELLKVRGYLVRDKDDYTAIYAEKPHKGKTEWVNDSCLMTINDARLVPDIEFEDEPVEVEVTLKRLNTGG